MSNPQLVEVTRGGVVESVHTGAFAVVKADGIVVKQAGRIEQEIYPRSAIKAFQALPMVAAGVVDDLRFTPAELALACSSHGGEPEHVSAAASMLTKGGFVESDLECGAHWPMFERASLELAGAGETPCQLHNNCSGKHAGMLAFARALKTDPLGYIRRDHPVQESIAQTMGRLCEFDVPSAHWAVDGCSVPTWAVPLQNVALGFARFCTNGVLEGDEATAATKILQAVSAHPYMVAGEKRFCTGLMKRVPRVFVKTGAEGVYCGCVPHLGLGVTVKCDDGTTRAAECIMATVLAELDGFSADERDVFRQFATRPVKNRRDMVVGEIRSTGAI